MILMIIKINNANFPKPGLCPVWRGIGILCTKKISNSLQRVNKFSVPDFVLFRKESLTTLETLKSFIKLTGHIYLNFLRPDSRLKQIRKPL